MKIRFITLLFFVSAIFPAIGSAEPTYIPSPCPGNMPAPNNGDSWLINNCVKPLDQIRLVEANWIDPEKLPRVTPQAKTVKKPVRRYYKKRTVKKVATAPKKTVRRTVAKKRTSIPPLTASQARRPVQPTAAELMAAQRSEDTSVTPPRLQ